MPDPRPSPERHRHPTARIGAFPYGVEGLAVLALRP